MERDCTEPSKCRSCGQEILWGLWPTSGKKMPVDATPDMRPPDRGGGKVVLSLDRRANVLKLAKFDPQQHDEKRNRYTSHFATCPNAAEHRKGGES